MKRNTTDCRHRNAFPTVFMEVTGFYWCPDCGAYRLLNCNGNSLTYESRGWTYPTGIHDVIKQLERKSCSN